MKAEVTWQGDMTFGSKIRSHEVLMDAKRIHGGSDQGPSPKELVLAAISGCTAMDVVAVLKKVGTLEDLQVTTSGETTSEHPKIFKEVFIEYRATGERLTAEDLMDAVEKSQTLYCGVSAMISGHAVIRYSVYLNGSLAGEGEAKFPAS